MPVQRILIVGAGAMGGLFGGLMAERGLDVTLFDVWREHVDAINLHGLKMVGYGGDRAVHVSATTDARTVNAADVVLFQCKAFANEAAARSVQHLFTGETVAISFQNGLGNEEALGKVLGMKNILGGLTAQAGLVEAPGIVRNFGDLPTYIGELTGGLSARVTQIAATFTRHQVTTHASSDIKRDKWKKLLGNIGLSALSGVTDLRSVDIMRVPELQATVLRAVDEAAAVARASGVALDVAEARSILMKLVDPSGGTGTSKSSLNEDLARGRPTEVDYIYGSVAKLGREHGVPTPTIDTFIAIVKGLESKYMPSVART